MLLQGYSKVVDNKSNSLELEQLNSENLSTHSLLIDKLIISANDKEHLQQSIEQAFVIGKSKINISFVNNKTKTYTSDPFCYECNISVAKPSLSMFSYNNGAGACQKCQGFGLSAQINWNKVIPDLSKSIADESIAALNFGSHTNYYEAIKKSARSNKISIKKKFYDYSQRDWDWLKYGAKEFKGLTGYFSWLDTKKYKPHYRIHAAKFNQYKQCSSCLGTRFAQHTKSYKINELNITQVYTMSIDDLYKWILKILDNKELKTEIKVLQVLLQEATERINYLQQIGLGYLSLDRNSRSLSGGEWQRVQMAKCLGHNFNDTLYCLDEPTSGLHQEDIKTLVVILKKLRDQGNTIVAVEHEKHVIDQADYIVEIGPESGSKGGFVVTSGYNQDLKSTKRYKPNTFALFPIPETSTKKLSFITIKEANTHNLKSVCAQIALGKSMEYVD